uniref:Putative secreted protein n=1 Tax=Ixodes ricinus TaxID=34613 RepID=A0A6B0UYJ9_IXORI
MTCSYFRTRGGCLFVLQLFSPCFSFAFSAIPADNFCLFCYVSKCRFKCSSVIEIRRLLTLISLNLIVVPKCKDPKGLLTLCNAQYALLCRILREQPARPPGRAFSPVSQKLEAKEGVGRRRLAKRFWKAVNSESQIEASLGIFRAGQQCTRYSTAGSWGFLYDNSFS